MRKQFDIKYRPQIESGEYKVETRDGRPARVICWDRKGSLPLVVLVPTKNGDEYSYDYTSDGSYHLGTRKSELDLFIITPEQELSEFEKELESFYNHHLRVCTYDNQGTVEDSLHYWAYKLLSLARKELEPAIKAEALKEFEEKYKQSWFNEGKIAGKFEGLTEDKKYLQGVHDGKEEALKDLPRWERLYSKENSDKIPDGIIPGKALDNRLVHRGFELKITDLEKLPGFKEDSHE